MRRKEREIKDPDIIHEILSQSSICRLAIHDEPYPYLVPMNFGYRNNALYFHCATGGRKLDLLKQNNKVGFEIEYDSQLIKGDVACQWTTKYRSIIGTGEMNIITNDDEKREGFDIIMQQHGKHDNTYIQAALDKALVLKLEINSLSAKQAGDW
ncbi:pyridoxamine 5'-phosphate oxidase family protein [Carboxylicivirga sp. M1479]|uniref:pyridoxamine 5'-phosphate oxidase family protein n=1 Tax=Carboxylicivirga sp. M1479 TaxID=2594476 RepID=UPI0011780440|nr:pyridoxamine 5'-phosphate oxidase family protein [Carboxylicivirga sp. M1479]TRX66220.1 pyridoxamine 5'-phosphate oxidase family protein [Carboxylicivirga sp. M1479]